MFCLAVLAMVSIALSVISSPCRSRIVDEVVPVTKRSPFGPSYAFKAFVKTLKSTMTSLGTRTY